jgi:hypothetical protein
VHGAAALIPAAAMQQQQQQQQQQASASRGSCWQVFIANIIGRCTANM